MKMTAEVPAWLLESTDLKDRALARLTEMPEASRERVPSPDSWSASEVVEHLTLVEEQVAGPWRKALEINPSAIPGLKSEILSAMVSTVFARTGMRVPTVAELEPGGGLSLSDLTFRWENARKTLLSAIPENPKAAWIMHPVFGPLSSDQMGKLLVAHLKHHLRHWPEVDTVLPANDSF